MNTTNIYFESVKTQSVFEKWPQHNQAEQMERMLSASAKLTDLHKDPSEWVSPDEWRMGYSASCSLFIVH